MASNSLSTEPEKKACMILSRLFLDTEITSNEVEDIATSLCTLDISTATLSHMLRHDLFPILYPNLISTTGVWEGFDQDWLLDQVATRAANPGWIKGMGDSVAWFTVGRMVVPSWDQVKEILQSKL